MLVIFFVLSLCITTGLLLSFYYLKKKKESRLVEWIKSIKWEFLTGCLISLLINYVLLLYKARIDYFLSTLYFSFIQICVLLVKPVKQIKGLIHKERNFKGLILATLSIVFILGETFISNRDSLVRTTPFDVNLSSLVADCPINEDGSLDLNKTTTLEYVLEEDCSNIEFSFDGFSQSTLKISIKDSESNLITSFYTDSNNEYFNITSLDASKGEKIYIVIEIDQNRYCSENDGNLVSITLNSKIPYKPHFLRPLSLTLLIYVFIYINKLIDKLKNRDPKKRIYIILGGAALIGLLVSFIVTLVKGSPFCFEYPLDSTSLASKGTDIYVRLFDALKKGQFNLDIPVSEGLASSTDPWGGTRSFSYFWDHAFYNGNYYCYYGIFPVLVFSFPFYWLTGRVLTAFGLQFFSFSILLPAFAFLVHEIYLLANKNKINYFNYCVLLFVGCITSLMLLTVTFKSGGSLEATYHTPIIAGLAQMDLFLGFVISGYRNKRQRILLLPLSGLSFVFLIMSRPSLCFSLLLTLPFYIEILFEKDAFKTKIFEFGPMFLVLLGGAAFVCYYNYSRFNSILEFGQSYQMTVADQRNLTYSTSKIYPSILHFFFQGPVFYKEFPYISCSVSHYSFDNCPYIKGYFGICLIPIFALEFFTILFFKKEDKLTKKVFAITFPIELFLLAFTTYSKAGVCARYLIEIYHIATIGFIFSVVVLLSRIQVNRNNVLRGIIIVGLISVFITLSLSFDTFDGLMEGDLFGLKLFFREIIK